MKQLYKRVREYIPLFTIIMMALSFISLILFIIVLNSVEFADFFNYHIASFARWLLAFLTSWIPFSLAELFIILLPIWIITLLIVAIKTAKKGKKPTVRFISVLFGIVCYIFVTFVWTYSSGFHTTTIEKQLDLKTENLTKQDLYEATMYVVENINDLSTKIQLDESGSADLPYNYRELSKEICKAYELYEEKHGVIKSFNSKIKPIMLSKPLTYTHISGIYTFMTGEGNVNVNYPDFIVVSSATHEMSHQRGVARENESNFTALVVLINSENDFLKYCGYLDMYRYLSNALYSVDKELFKQMYGTLCTQAKVELSNYAKFFEKYEDSKASEVTDKVNDSYLQANGQEHGTKSYGMIVEVSCAYIKQYKMN